MRKRIRLAALLLSVSAASVASVPVTMSYQGFLTDPNGVALDTATPIPIEFRLYTVASGGTPIWTDTLSVNVAGGLFSVSLGDDPLNGFPPGAFDTPLFLGIAVNGDPEMTPRRTLTSVAFSFNADRLEGRSASELDQSDEIAALAANTVVALDGLIAPGGGGEVLLDAPAGLHARASGNGPDLVLGGAGVGGSADDGIIASLPGEPGSDLVMQSNDSISLFLDSDLGAEVANLSVLDGFGNLLLNLDETGSLSLRRAATLRAPNDAANGPIIALGGSVSDQAESGRIRFLEGTAAGNLRGAYMHYNGAANLLHIGTHDASTTDPADDRNVLSIERSSGEVGLNTTAPNRELTIADGNANGDAAMNLTASGRELLVAVNQSSGGLISMQTANDLQLRTGGVNRMTVRADGNVQVLNDVLVEGQALRDYGTESYRSFAPFARGTIVEDTSTGTNLRIADATANVQSVAHVSNFHEITLTASCQSGGGFPFLDNYQLVVTPRNAVTNLEGQVRCNANKVVLWVVMNGGLDHAPFSFVVFGP